MLLNIISALHLSFFQPSDNPRLMLNITGLQNQRGIVRVCLFNQSEGFPGEPSKAVRILEAKPAKNGTRFIFEGLDYSQKYAIAVLHDENENGVMDFSFLGFPIEPFGISNNGISFGKPDFDVAAFSVTSDTTLTITLRHLF